MRKVVVVGAGIVGTAVAAELASRPNIAVRVIDKGAPGSNPGSTGRAPGFVGQLNETEVLTDLARMSADRYDAIARASGAGFLRVGGVEVALGADGLRNLEHRAELARERGLTATLLGPREAAALNPRLIDPDRCVGGLFHPRDGVADGATLAGALRTQAVRAGAEFSFDTAFESWETVRGRMRLARTSRGAIAADDVVIACGVWGPEVVGLAGRSLPLTPVAHPYVYGTTHRMTDPTPFVRWPERHVCARDHGRCLGFGTYDHVPAPVDVVGACAEQAWPGEPFEPAVDAAIDLLPSATRFTPARRVNGLFSMTADNLPLVGPAGHTEGLWLAEAVWVTHAAGAARALVELMHGEQPSATGMESLSPSRFDTVSAEELTRRSLTQYHDIYRHGTAADIARARTTAP
ncbi:NAD(P)/FAD-dependent oxidoreductase [Pseudonocardia spinosispora]|uniref:NAD(P)/FAD-dependent oxidoreductase n=1 Tax=Pseudonocardia spinosispora TaxID=103441 RepID=UPI00042208F5|nr:FAD-binding oxidoreductase [Pseudonocardia spinosispora]